MILRSNNTLPLNRHRIRFSEAFTWVICKCDSCRLHFCQSFQRNTHNPFSDDKAGRNSGIGSMFSEGAPYKKEKRDELYKKEP